MNILFKSVSFVAIAFAVVNCATVLNSNSSSSSSERVTGDHAAQMNVLKKVSDSLSRAVHLPQENCTTTTSSEEDCEESTEIPVICWIQVAGISVSFCLFLVCYIQYRRLRVRSRQFKSQLLL